MRPMPILYVEDEENDALFVKLALEHAAVQTPLQVVTDGQQALRYLSGNGKYKDREQYPFPCLVLLDLNLPLVSGFEVLTWVRSQPSMNDLPVVVFSSSNQPQDIQQAQQLGADDYLVKPVNMGKLDELLRALKQKWLDRLPAHAA